MLFNVAVIHSACFEIFHNMLGSRGVNWRRKWQPTPVLLPGKFHGLRGSLEPGRLQSMGLQSQTRLSDFTLLYFRGVNRILKEILPG